MRNVIAGLILLVIATIAGWQASTLTLGTVRHIGPGMFPMVLAALIALIGIILVGTGLKESLRERERYHDRWPLRGPLFILGAAVVFGLAVRPLGLAAAGPLLVIVGGLASRETRWLELITFALGMTVFCIVLFKYLLSLPIPLAPWLMGY
jgi:putative tricarboxylic transport membrane protein